MRYSSVEDEAVTNQIRHYLKKIIFESDYELFEAFFDDRILVTPSNLSNRSKLEFFLEKKRLLADLKFSLTARITNPQWAEVHEKEMFYYWLNDMNGLANKIASLQALHAKLERRAIAYSKRKCDSSRKKTVSFRRRKAAKMNGFRSGLVRHEKSQEARQTIIIRAFKLLAQGQSQHHLVAILEKHFPFSGRQIRRYLAQAGICGKRLYQVQLSDTAVAYRKSGESVYYEFYGH